MNLKKLKRSLYSTYLLYGLKLFLALTGAVLAPLLLSHNGLISIPPILGVVAAGLTDLDDHLRNRLKNIVTVLVVFFVAGIGVELLMPYPLLFFIGIVVASGAIVLMGALGPRYGVISFGALVVMVYTMLTYSPNQPIYYQPFLLVLGALWYNIVSLFFNMIWPVRPLQESMSACYRQLSLFLEAKSQFFDPDEFEEFHEQTLRLTQINHQLAESLDQMRIAIMKRLRNDRGQKSVRDILMYYLVAQEIYERAGSSHVEYEALRSKFNHSDVLFRFQRLLLQQGIGCQKIADELIGREKYVYAGYGERLINRLQSTLSMLQESHKADAVSVYSMGSLLKNLMGIDRLFRQVSADSSDPLDATNYINRFIPEERRRGGFKAAFQKIRQHLTRHSEIFRHAVRMSTILGIGYLIAFGANIIYMRFSGETAPLTTPFWIMLTSVFVSQPNYSSTRSRLVKRLWGTLFGVLITIGLLELGLSELGQILLVVISGTLFFSFRLARYSFATAFITIMVLLCFNLIDAGFVAPERLLDTIIGCGLSWLAVTFIWPDWQFRQLNITKGEVAKANSLYLEAVRAQYHQGRDEDLNYLLARDNANSADGKLATLFSSLFVEPRTTQQELDQIFTLLCANNGFLGYISALGAHRAKIEAPDILQLLDETVAFIRASLEDLSVDRVQYLRLKNRIDAEQEALQVHDQQVEEILLQQLRLLLKSLPSFVAGGEEIIDAESDKKSDVTTVTDNH